MVVYIQGYLNRLSFNTFNDTKFLEGGVPQGSALCPILFLIYVNSIFELHLKEHLTAFADDFSLAYK